VGEKEGKREGEGGWGIGMYVSQISVVQNHTLDIVRFVLMIISQHHVSKEGS